MNRGLYIGASSLVNNQRRMDVLSNNLANINTTGYKKDFSISESFPEKLLIKKSQRAEINRRVDNNIEYENLGNNRHRAKIKDGYFRIETPIGRSNVKEIEFLVDGEDLKTSYKNLDGTRRTDYENYILDRNGNRVNNPVNINEEFINQLVYNPRRHVVGTMSAGVNFKRTFTDLSQGGIMDTEADLDLALMGDGFFKIQGDEEILYTRSGSFSLDQNNYLVDLDGRQVLGTNGPIQIIGKEVNISENGRVTVDGNNIGQLDIVRINNSEFLRKVGNSNFRMAIDSDGEEIPAAEENFEGRVLQGYLETSNMNAVQGMVEMITLLRDFEANQKVVKMQDEMLEKAATEIGRV